MEYVIRVTDNAREDFQALDARWRSAVKAAHGKAPWARACEGKQKPQYRLRVDTIRVFYDIESNHVNVLGIVPKDRADEWLAQYGEAL